MKITIILTSGLACVALCAHAADTARYVSTQGKWTLNKAETRYPPGIDITGNVMDVTVDDGHVLRYTETVTLGGQAMTQSFDGAYDGKPRPIDNGQTLSFRHLSTAKYRATRHDADGRLMERSDCTVASHGAKMSCRVQAFPKEGKPVRFVEVFDKAS